MDVKTMFLFYLVQASCMIRNLYVEGSLEALNEIIHQFDRTIP